MKRMLLIPLFVLLSLAVACRPQRELSVGAIQPAEQDPGPLPAPTEEAPAPTTQMAQADELLLLWEGAPPGEGVDGKTCGRLEIRAGGAASFGPCDGSTTTTPFAAPYWEEIVARFAPFAVGEGENQLYFQGRGEVDGPAWQRALASWARTTYGELASGRACAACRTILTWSFGPLAEDVERCAILWATDFGYAYRGTLPCEGGQTQVTAEAWLETAEWVQLDTWLRTRAPLTLGDNGETGLLAQGSEEMNEAEQAALALWSSDVAARLQRQLSQTDGPGSLVPVDVQHVEVEVGVGSPIPVDAVVAGLWPGLCAQLAQIRQDVREFRFDITLLTDPGPADCPPDYVGLTFGMAIPINVAELQEGTYTLTVNDVSTTFEVPVTPASFAEKTTTYRNEEVGFEFDYPASWFIADTQSQGTDSRGQITNIASWPNAADSAAIPAGETRFDVTVLRWEPLDLAQYVATRKGAWEASGLAIVSEESWLLANDLQAARFLVATPDEGTVFFLFTLTGDRFVSLSGAGDLERLEEIGRTLRAVEGEGQNE